MRVVVPYAVTDPKSRLSGALSESEREAFSLRMLADVLSCISAVGCTPEVVATAPVELSVPVQVDDRALSPAINAILRDTQGAVAIVMADLALLTPRVLDRFFSSPGDVVIAPGRGGGTNALIIRDPDFRVDYHGSSYLDHLRNARDVGANVYEFDSSRIGTDIDEESDLVEVLLHGEGAAREWLLDAGFSVAIDTGRIRVTRS